MAFVRPARPTDLDQLATFDEWGKANAESIRAGECFVAGHESDALAYGIFNRSFYRRPFVATIFVHPDHRRAGLCSALIRHFEMLAQGERLWISTNIENLAMQRALDKLGFSLSGVIHNLAKLPEVIYFKG